MNTFRRILLTGALTAIPLIAGGCSLGQREPEAPPVTLEFWGVFDDSQTLDPFIKEFEAINPNITVNYTQRGPDTYEADIVNEFAAGRGPDVWAIHNTWLPKHQDKIQPFPAEELSVASFQRVFADVATTDLTTDSAVYAIPTYIDTLGLIANRDILQSAGIASLPTTWEDFNDDVTAVTRYDNLGNITRSGAAIGAASNVNRAPDILSALMLQSGVSMTNTNQSAATWAREDADRRNRGAEALTFYTNFALPSKQVYTWDLSQDQSIDAFIAGKTTFLVNYAFTANIVRERAPQLSLSVGELPQLEANGRKITYANYWALAVSKVSQQSAAARKFIQFMASNAADAVAIKDGEELGKEVNARYLEAFQRPAARRDLIEAQQRDSVALGPFAAQALVARSWYIVDDTSYESIFADMIDDVILGRETITGSLQKGSDRYAQVLKDTADRRERAGLNGSF